MQETSLLREIPWIEALLKEISKSINLKTGSGVTLYLLSSHS